MRPGAISATAPRSSRARSSNRRFLSALLRAVFLAVTPLLAAAADLGDAPPLPLVSASLLETKIAEAEAATDLTDEARARLVALYRKSLGNLKTAEANEAAAAAFRGTAEAAPARIESLLEVRAETLADEPTAQPASGRDLPLSRLERRLQEEQADLAAVKGRHDELVARLALQQARPGVVRQRLIEAEKARETAYARLRAEITDAAAEGRATALTEARRWELETRYHALGTEIRMLDQELLTHSVRLQLLELQRDEEAAGIDRIAAQVRALESRILAARRQAAEQDRADAERMRRETAGMDPVLSRLSEANAELSRDIAELTAAMRELDGALARADRLHERIDADYSDTRETLDAEEIGSDLGAVLLEQLNALPDLSGIRQQREQREARIAQINARVLRERAEARRLGDVEASVASLTARLGTAPTAAQHERIKALVIRRLELLDRMLKTQARYVAEAQALNAAEDALLADAAEYRALLMKRLAWLRTEAPTGLRELLALPGQLGDMHQAARTGELLRRPTTALAASPVFWAALLLAAGLLWGRRRIVAALDDIAGRVGKPTTDRFGHTLRALFLTVLLALALPLPVGAAGWVLLTDPAGTELTLSLGEALLRIAMILFTLKLLIALCRPRGVAAAHFRWPEHNLTLLRGQSRQLLWLLIPAVVLLYLARSLYPLQSGGMPGRLAGTIAFAALAWFLYRVFHPRRGAIAHLRRPQDYSLLVRGYWVWYPLLVLYPLALVVLGLSGYLYTVTVESQNYLASLLLVLTVVLLNALGLRWLLVVRRRLAYDAALERRRAAAAAEQDGGEAAESQVEEPVVDLSALSDDTSRLLRVGIGAIAVIGLALIWLDTLPALRVLEEQTLWHTTVTVDGEEQKRPVTLLNLGLALLFAAATVVLLKRLPALLEIVLLRRYAMSAADRYAVKTLTGYVLGAIGILLVLGTLGASWTQLQWMAAALSVGIGFGLQEIVANFISGLIILFERPIRVGDTVTVGDTDGVVTRIRIRATTIRNWDRKELVVPNKEFITGRLLNWSLSDPVTRIVIVVGIAYGSNVDEALAIMKRLAEAQEHVVDNPPPRVTFDTFGDNALTLTLRAFVDSIDVRLETITELNRAINRAFAEAGLSIAFPQRDVHVDTSTPLRVHIDSGSTTR